MKKHVIAGALTLSLVLGMGFMAGCSSEASPEQNVNADVPAGAPPLMPATHEGRFDSWGADGCYGCHGANDKANPMLNGSVSMPDDHYTDGSSTTMQIDPSHAQCNTCHVQG